VIRVSRVLRVTWAVRMASVNNAVKGF